jgi:hypothetical protein
MRIVDQVSALLYVRFFDPNSFCRNRFGGRCAPCSAGSHRHRSSLEDSWLFGMVKHVLMDSLDSI